MKLTLAALLTVVASMTAAHSALRVGAIHLKELTSQSSVIVVGRVTAVESGTPRLARFEVEQSIKGNVPPHFEFEFIAQPIWACDTSHAVLAERLLLFVNPVKAGSKVGLKGSESFVLGRDAYQIAHHGRGRIKLLGAGSTSRIEFKSNDPSSPPDIGGVILPRNLPYQRRSETTTLSTQALLSRVKSLVGK